jgi:hypothetical protein
METPHWKGNRIIDTPPLEYRKHSAEQEGLTSIKKLGGKLDLNAKTSEISINHPFDNL